MCTRLQCFSKLHDATPYIRQEFGVTSLCVFGSMARGDNRHDSDVDICVDMPPKMNLVIGLKLYLEELFGTHVDLIRRHRDMRPLFISNIEKDAVYFIR